MLVLERQAFLGREDGSESEGGTGSPASAEDGPISGVLWWD